MGASVVGCESKAGTGAIVGGAGGAAAGGLIGSMSHARAGEGALIGGAIGAIGGALIGHGMDESDKKKAEENDRYADRSSYLQAAVANPNVTKKDVINWTARGTRDDVIIDRIERSGTVYHLTAKDENELRDQGVSEEVILAMKATARR
jgi:hypothetical protein